MVCEPSGQAYEAFCELFEEACAPPPPNQPELEKLLLAHDLDTVFIITPHALHFSQASACLEAGLDVLLEKPMVMNAEEALALIDVQRRSGRLLSVAFNGSMSPQVRKAAKLLRAGSLGKILNISAVVWQNWMVSTAGLWRQVPEIAGGGFLFDTGAHMLNTISDLAGEDFVEVAAWMDNQGAPVDILAAVIARLASGALVSDERGRQFPTARSAPTCACCARRGCCKQAFGENGS